MKNKTKHDYITEGICAKSIHYEIVDNKIKNLSFAHGCDGNLKGLSAIVEGMEVEEVIKRLEGITCGTRISSCPDQLAKALKVANVNVE